MSVRVHVWTAQLELCGLVERHRFLLLELHECYSTYLMRREQTTEVLDQLRHHQLTTDSSPQHDQHMTTVKLVRTTPPTFQPNHHCVNMSFSAELS